MKYFTNGPHFGSSKTLNKLKLIEIIQNMFSDQSGIKSKIQNRKIARNPQIFGNLMTYFCQAWWYTSVILAFER
jgi:hypothetical protein